jgi:hypothetical protein
MIDTIANKVAKIKLYYVSELSLGKGGFNHERSKKMGIC